jgi:hypothetical protein
MDQPDFTQPIFNDENNNDIIRATLYAREQEFRMIQAQLQQQLDIQSRTIDQLERTISASTDRLMRRLDRIEHHRNSDTKRSSFNSRKYRA